MAVKAHAMEAHAVTAKVAGALFIAATAASLAGTALQNPVFDSSRYLATTSAHQGRILAGVFLLMLSAFASAGIAICLYPVLKGYGHGLALGAVGFRIVEGVLSLVSALGALLLLALSQGLAGHRRPVPLSAQLSGEVLKELRNGSSLLSITAFCVGAAMYYCLFYRSNLIPRWLSAWGIAGVALGFVVAIVVLFRLTGFLSTTDVILNVPIGVNEMVLAVWLIARGFTAPPSSPRHLEQLQHLQDVPLGL